MIKVVYSDSFVNSAKKLPKQQKEKLSKLLVLLTENPFHPLLHSKPLVGQLAGLYSFRIT